jgi:hypothetical protein
MALYLATDYGFMDRYLEFDTVQSSRIMLTVTSL